MQKIIDMIETMVDDYEGLQEVAYVTKNKTTGKMTGVNFGEESLELVKLKNR